MKKETLETGNLLVKYIEQNKKALDRWTDATAFPKEWAESGEVSTVHVKTRDGLKSVEACPMSFEAIRALNIGYYSAEVKRLQAELDALQDSVDLAKRHSAPVGPMS